MLNWLGQADWKETDYSFADDFNARSADELTLSKSDRIELIELDEGFGDGWYLGKHLGRGITGLFPGGTCPSNAALLDSLLIRHYQCTPTRYQHPCPIFNLPAHLNILRRPLSLPSSPHLIRTYHRVNSLYFNNTRDSWRQKSEISQIPTSDI